MMKKGGSSKKANAASDSKRKDGKRVDHNVSQGRVGSSLSQHNNLWYQGEHGEQPKKFTTGSFTPIREPSKAASSRADPYTKSRNPAGDGERYAYINDCTNTLRRDNLLRYSAPVQAVASAPVVFPPIGQKDRNFTRPEIQAMPATGMNFFQKHSHQQDVVVLRAKQDRLSGITSPSRFAAC
jgi:hypothetical protein